MLKQSSEPGKTDPDLFSILKKYSTKYEEGPLHEINVYVSGHGFINQSEMATSIEVPFITYAEDLHMLDGGIIPRLVFPYSGIPKCLYYDNKNELSVEKIKANYNLKYFEANCPQIYRHYLVTPNLCPSVSSDINQYGYDMAGGLIEWTKGLASSSKKDALFSPLVASRSWFDYQLPDRRWTRIDQLPEDLKARNIWGRKEDEIFEEFGKFGNGEFGEFINYGDYNNYGDFGKFGVYRTNENIDRLAESLRKSDTKTHKHELVPYKTGNSYSYLYRTADMILTPIEIIVANIRSILGHNKFNLHWTACRSAIPVGEREMLDHATKDYVKRIAESAL